MWHCWRCERYELGSDGKRRALQAAQELRSAGLSTVFEYRERRLGNQLKSANQVGARLAVIYGPEEVAAKQARVRNMSTGDETVVAGDKLVESCGKA